MIRNILWPTTMLFHSSDIKYLKKEERLVHKLIRESSQNSYNGFIHMMPPASTGLILSKEKKLKGTQMLEWR